MKRVTFILLVTFMVLSACSSSQKLPLNMDGYAAEKKPADSVLASLQNANDLLLVYAVEDYAWTRTINYYILASNNNEWRSYYYKADQRNALIKKERAAIIKRDVPKASGDSVFSYFTNNEVWKIKGDNGKDFCQTTLSGSTVSACNITDQPTSKLMIITKTKVATSSYYAPEYFEKCCPGNEDRKKFLIAVRKIKALVGTAQVR